MQKPNHARPACQQSTLTQRADAYAQRVLGRSAKLIASTVRLELYECAVLDRSDAFLAGRRANGSFDEFDDAPESMDSWL